MKLNKEEKEEVEKFLYVEVRLNGDVTTDRRRHAGFQEGDKIWRAPERVRRKKAIPAEARMGFRQ